MNSEEARRQIEEAHRILRADYWSDVRGVTDELKDRLKKGYHADREDFLNDLEEIVNDHQRVIYTFQAQQCLLYSDNDDAYLEEFGTEGVTEDGQIMWSRLAYAAFRADVIEQLAAEGVDVNDPIPEPEATDP